MEGNLIHYWIFKRDFECVENIWYFSNSTVIFQKLTTRRFFTPRKTASDFTEPLIDIKTTKYLSFTQDLYNQLIGYYILSKLGKINESEDIPISRIGIYFSRHGILHTISTDDIENYSNFPKFVKWFEKSASVIFTEKLRSIS